MKAMVSSIVLFMSVSSCTFFGLGGDPNELKLTSFQSFEGEKTRTLVGTVKLPKSFPEKTRITIGLDASIDRNINWIVNEWIMGETASALQEVKFTIENAPDKDLKVVAIAEVNGKPGGNNGDLGGYYVKGLETPTFEASSATIIKSGPTEPIIISVGEITNIP